MRFFKLTLTAFAVLSLVCGLVADELKGIVLDSQWAFPVPGAMVKLVGHDNSAVTDTSGIFRISDVPQNATELVITHLSYKVTKQSFHNNDDEMISIWLEPVILHGQDVIVTANRAEKGETPATFTNISRDHLDYQCLTIQHPD